MILAYEKLLLMVKNNLIINPSIIAAIHKDRAFAITKPNLLQNFAKADTEKQRDTISEENEATTKPFSRRPSIQYGSFQRRAKLIIAAKPTPIKTRDANKIQPKYFSINSNDTEIINGTYYLGELTDLGITVQVKKPTDGEVTIDNGVVKNYYLAIDDYKVKNDGGNPKI